MCTHAIDTLVEQKSKREQTHWPCEEADVERKHRRLENGAETGANARRHIACMRASILRGSVPGEPLHCAGEQAAFAKEQPSWEACDALCASKLNTSCPSPSRVLLVTVSVLC
jgi:hypothetical protein